MKGELADDLPAELEVRHLVGPHRHPGGLVEDDVRGHEDRVAEEAVEGEVAVGEVLPHLLVGGGALQPAERGDHPEQEVELGVLLHLALHEEGGPLRVDPRGDEVHEHVPLGLPDGVGLLVVRGQRVPVGAEEEAGVVGLQLHPVGEGAVEVAEVEAPGGAHAGDDDGAGVGHGGRVRR
jgi:hypothetical protein